MRPVNLDPAFNPLHRLEHPPTVDRQVARHRELRERFQCDFGADLVDQRRAGRPRAPVNDHGATAADGLKATLLPDDGRRALAAAVHRISADIHQADDNVYVRAITDAELFPIRPCPRLRLTFDFQIDVLRHGHVCDYDAWGEPLLPGGPPGRPGKVR
jgi:hypothetical protein